MTTTYSPVVVTLDELTKGINDETLEAAFGPDSLGIILVKGLPEKFPSLRNAVLTSASELATLPEDKLRLLESEESMWLTGWSRGKEKLANTGLPDTLKGSYYINCAFHKDPVLEGPTEETTSRFGDDQFKCYTAPNIWPDENAEKNLKGFQDNCKELCNLIIDVAEVVASNCDNYILKKLKATKRIT